MAEQDADTPDTDFAAHEQTYEAFVRGTKTIVVSIAVILIAMALFL